MPEQKFFTFGQLIGPFNVVASEVVRQNGHVLETRVRVAGDMPWLGWVERDSTPSGDPETVFIKHNISPGGVPTTVIEAWLVGTDEERGVRQIATPGHHPRKGEPRTSENGVQYTIVTLSQPTEEDGGVSPDEPEPYQLVYPRASRFNEAR